MIVVFAGPTIGHDEVQQVLDCVCLPPVSHGDIIRLMADPPLAIGIVDGYFEGAPSVWHKEILYALDQGVHVFGASSMGALRAAELDVFGMRGVGQTYEWYRDGVIEDDDEVAVLHGPEEVEFAVASEPMVSIRASLAQAVDEACISQTLADELIAKAKSTFYKKRSWRGLLKDARSERHAGKLDSLETWLGSNAIDLKKRDAVAMLTVMADEAEEFVTPFKTAFHFEWTHVWDTAFRDLGGRASEDRVLGQDDADVLDELRLNVERFERIADRAIVVWLAANQVTLDVDMKTTRQALTRFREDNGLTTRAQLLDYMARSGLDETKLTRLMEDAARMRQVREVARDDRTQFEALMIEELVRRGEYAGLLDLVERKRKAGAYRGGVAGRRGVKRPQLLTWFFERREGGRIPDDLDRYLERIDLDRDGFYRILAGEYLFRSA